MPTEDVIVEKRGNVGLMRLNRPKALHTLNEPMCAAMLRHLIDWSNDSDICLVIIDHRDGRGFCAGGDIRMLADSGARDGSAAASFFRTEYRLNHLLFSYKKAVVAFMDGVTMGGGVGLSRPARFRVTTERTSLAMPESGIGLFPDVGGGWYLSRLPGRLGVYLALTGDRLDGADCCALNFATHYMHSNDLERVKDALLRNPRAVEEILLSAAAPPSASRIAEERARIDRLFSAARLEDILENLARDGSGWSQSVLSELLKKSPQACKVSLRLLAQASGLTDFAEEMRVEYRVATRICRSHDFIEGVRALIVDKDNKPMWNPAAAEGVSGALLDRFFAPISVGDEWTPAHGAAR